MKILKSSELLSRNDLKPFLLGCLYSRLIPINSNQYFVTTATFKESKYVFKTDFDFKAYKKEYLDVINYYSGYEYWFEKKREPKCELDLPKADFLFVIENDLNQTVTTFFRSILSKIYSSNWIDSDFLTEDKKQFVRGFMEIRGSIDTSRALITQDYFYNSISEISKVKLLFDFLNIPICVGNINFRELQYQYVNNINKRNPQFRIDLYWYSKNIGYFNKYKARIFKNRYYGEEYIDKDVTYFLCQERNKRNLDTFVKYINYFQNNVIGKDLQKNEIMQLRQRLGFEESNEPTERRNKLIIDLYREISEDRCAICGTTTTYTNSRTGRQHFEIHHMISYKNGKELDIIDNLVKLCPTCHDMMKKSSGLKNDQIEAIKKILKENDTVYEFCSTYLGIDDYDELSQKIQEMLG